MDSNGSCSPETTEDNVALFKRHRKLQNETSPERREGLPSPGIQEADSAEECNKREGCKSDEERASPSIIARLFTPRRASTPTKRDIGFVCSKPPGDSRPKSPRIESTDPGTELEDYPSSYEEANDEPEFLYHLIGTPPPPPPPPLLICLPSPASTALPFIKETTNVKTKEYTTPITSSVCSIIPTTLFTHDTPSSSLGATGGSSIAPSIISSAVESSPGESPTDFFVRNVGAALRLSQLPMTSILTTVSGTSAKVRKKAAKKLITRWRKATKAGRPTTSSHGRDYSTGVTNAEPKKTKGANQCRSKLYKFIRDNKITNETEYNVYLKDPEICELESGIQPNQLLRIKQIAFNQSIQNADRVIFSDRIVPITSSSFTRGVCLQFVNSIADENGQTMEHFSYDVIELLDEKHRKKRGLILMGVSDSENLCLLIF